MLDAKLSLKKIKTEDENKIIWNIPRYMLGLKAIAAYTNSEENMKRILNAR